MLRSRLASVTAARRTVCSGRSAADAFDDGDSAHAVDDQQQDRSGCEPQLPLPMATLTMKP